MADDDVRTFKDLANHYGERIFAEVAKFREELTGKGVDDDTVTSILMLGISASLASVFSYAVAPDGVGEEEQTKIAADIRRRILDLIRDEYVNHGGQVLRINFEKL